jgi:hypothetical protein
VRERERPISRVRERAPEVPHRSVPRPSYPSYQGGGGGGGGSSGPIQGIR